MGISYVRNFIMYSFNIYLKYFLLLFTVLTTLIYPVKLCDVERLEKGCSSLEHQESLLSSVISCSFQKEFNYQINFLEAEKKRKNHYIFKVLLKAFNPYDNELIKSILEIENKSIADIIYDTDFDGNTLLHLAVDTKNYNFINYCVKIGAINLNIKNNSGCTPLINAIKISDLEIVKALLPFGADTDNFEDTALYYALKMSSSRNYIFLWLSRNNVLKYILENGANINILQENLAKFSCILNEGGWMYETGFIIYNLNRKGFDLNTQDKDGKTLLITAIEHGHLNTAFLIIDIKQLLNVDFNIKDNQSNTALICAVLQNNLELVQRLVYVGADADVVNGLGQDLVSIALEREYRDIAEYLKLSVRHP